MIYTTYFAKLKKLPDDIIPICIAGKEPDWYKGLKYKALAQKYDFFMQWKKNNDNCYYVKCFDEQVLGCLVPEDVEERLYIMSEGKDVALVCYERPDDFCHRHLVAQWLKNAGIRVEEWKE